MQDLLIFPYGGNAIEAKDSVSSEYNFIGFIDDDPKKHGKTPLGDVVGGRELLKKHPQAKLLAVQANPLNFRSRKEVIEKLQVENSRYTNIIHPSAFVSPGATIGNNTIIMAGAVISAYATIGDHVIVLPNAVIHHHAHVKDYCFIGANVVIAGGVTVEENCFIGSGSTVIQNIRVGKKALVGMGSNVLKDVPEEVTIAGNPAKKL